MKTRTPILLVLTLAGSVWATTPEEEPAADPVVRAVQKALPAVVNVNTEQLVQRFSRDPFDELFRQFFGPPRGGIQSLGSGVVVDSEGWIVTNNHVVRRADRINVTLSDGTQYEARLVSGDDRNDLALLKIEPKKPLPYLELAGDTEPLLGETVLAIGNPFGFDHTVTKGIISAKNRKWPPDDPKFEDVLQTDAAINPGNSGGPLINTRGELVGINTAILSQAEGIGFAIPAKRVSNLLSAWFSPEKRARLWLGLRLARKNGRIVATDVQADSPAAKAGIVAGDAIVAADEQRFADVLQLQRYLVRQKAGTAVKFQIDRAGQRQTVQVTLAELPQVSATDLMLKKFGLQVQPLTADLAAALGMTLTRGLLVADVQRGSPAAAAELRRGMVISHVAGEEIDTLDRLAEQLADVKAGDAVALVILVSERRGGFTLQRTGTVTLKAR